MIEKVTERMTKWMIELSDYEVTVFYKIKIEEEKGIWRQKRKRFKEIKWISRMKIEFDKILNCEYIMNELNEMIGIIYAMKRNEDEMIFEWELYYFSEFD